VNSLGDGHERAILEPSLRRGPIAAEPRRSKPTVRYTKTPSR
jgi:hypothetical protein